jgi:diguanylate cyclase (GGDEF)-like protein
MVAAYFLSQTLLDRSFREFESNEALQSLRRVELLLSAQVDAARRHAYDYGVWDDTYAFVEQPNESYPGSNFQVDTLTNLDMDYMVIADLEGKVKLAYQVPQGAGASQEEIEIFEGPLRDRFVQIALQEIEQRDELHSFGTLRFFEQSPYLIAGTSILDSLASQPSRGVFVWVRALNQSRQLALAQQSQVKFSMSPPEGLGEAAEARFSGQKLSASLIVRDYRHRPSALLEIEQPRALIQQNSTARALGLLTLLGLVVVALPLCYFAFDRIVLRKAKRLIEDIQELQLADAPKLLPVRGEDEFDQISLKVNELIEALRLSESQIRHDATHDALTGFGNRRALLDALERAVSRVVAGALEHSEVTDADRSFSLLLLDLDHFKDVNDLHGHLAGDVVLVEVANRLRSACDSEVQAMRLGGDEFAFIVPELTAGAGERVANALLQALSEPILCGVEPVNIHASIGLLRVDRTLREDRPEDLLRKADIAMYAAKRAGRNRLCLFDDALQRDLSERKALENSLRDTLRRESFEVRFQPIYEAQRKRVVSIEALARWPHPQLGSIPPEVFVSLAEDLRVVSQLDLQILSKSLASFAQLLERHRELSLSVNVSVNTLLSERLSEKFEALLRHHHIPGSKLLLELTETQVARNEEDLKRPMNELRALGVRFQIDDFGTGYSSLARLHTLPFDIVKIDRSFVSDLGQGDDRLCENIIHLAHSLQLSVTAEGVEHDRQAEALRAMSCDQLQGYLFARPLTLREIIEHLDRN